jgi:hypothetical protein
MNNSRKIEAEKAAKKVLEKLERFATRQFSVATVSSDGVCYSESNLTILTTAILDAVEAENKACANIAKSHHDRNNCFDGEPCVECQVEKEIRARSERSMRGR